MSLPTHLDTVTIRELPEAEAAALLPLKRLERGQRMFAVQANGYSGHVVAGAMFIYEDDGDYAAPSKLLIEQL